MEGGYGNTTHHLPTYPTPTPPNKRWGILIYVHTQTVPCLHPVNNHRPIPKLKSFYTCRKNSHYPPLTLNLVLKNKHKLVIPFIHTICYHIIVPRNKDLNPTLLFLIHWDTATNHSTG